MASRRLSLLTLAFAPVLMLACTGKGDPSDPDPEPDPDPDPSFWLVGDQGTMLAVTASGEASTYPLEHDEDLRAIACLGERTAWVVGSGGAVLRSRDAGQRWESIDLGPSRAGKLEVDWTALAVAEASLETLETVWLVGSDGAIAHTPDGGASWTFIAGPTVDFTGVATTLDGSDAVAVAVDGSIWQLDATGIATAVHHANAPLHAIGLAVHGGHATAVGADGLMLTSNDSGATWLELELPTTRDLHAVRVGHDGQLSVAVGEAGVVVRVEADLSEVEVAEWPDAELGLYGLHMAHDGHGQAVGGNGTLLETFDFGLTWTSTVLPTTATLRGVDDFHVGGHL